MSHTTPHPPPGHQRCRWRRRGSGGERGSTTVEMVGYTALMLLCLLIGVQVATWGLAALACRYAANHALQTTRVAGGNAEAGRDDAAHTLDQVDANLLHDPRIEVSRSVTTATVTITATAVRVVPFLTLPVTAHVSAPVEALAP